MTKILEQIMRPEDLHSLSVDDCRKLSQEIRNFLIDTVSKTGGHLGPNLGVVELTIALLRTFNPPNDKIIWDVGHQSYIYKILTGRREFLQNTLRQDDGCCGFPVQTESEYDCFGTGHAGTAISAALGMAVARDLLHKKEKLIAVVGDGSLGCGISLEAINHIAEVTKDFVLIINDNEMSIGGNVGAISKHLDRIIASNKSKSIIRGHRPTRNSKNAPTDSTSMFAHLGINYIGPIDGHDITELEKTFQAIKSNPNPAVIHVVTEKGKGYEPAKLNPEKFHGLGAFDITTGKTGEANGKTFTAVFRDEIVRIAKENPLITAITAGMTKGTGLDLFKENFPSRFFDVGIAEEHAIIYAAGMAANGLRPVVSLYATFSQRAFDCVFHDICLQNLPVIITLDRAGIVADGPTHHGIYDLSFWSSMPNLTVMQPRDGWELEQMLNFATELESPVIIRYPKGNSIDYPAKQPLLELGKAEIVDSCGNDLFIWALGAEINSALQLMKSLEKSGIKSTVVNPRFIKPFDEKLFLEQLEQAPIVTIEDHSVIGGLATVTDIVAQKSNSSNRCHHLGWPDQIIEWGTNQGIRNKYSMDIKSITDRVTKIIKAQ